MPTQTVELEGHIIDSGILERCFRIIMNNGGNFDVETFEIGQDKHSESYARLKVHAAAEQTLQTIIHELNKNGAALSDPTDVTVDPAPEDGVVPPGFYSTTNHPTEIRYNGDWIPVENPEMDCAIVVEPDAPDGPRASTQVLNAIEAGDLVVTGDAGIRVYPPERPRDSDNTFGFMEGGVSSERPSKSLIREIATEIQTTVADGGSVLAVTGPAVVHSGGVEALAALIEHGYVNQLSAGNGFAVHDLERDLYGTSLGMDIETMDHPREGHKHHIYTISEIARQGGIKPAVEAGVIESGVMYQAVTNDVPYVLAGSIRDDGPLPDTITNSIEAQNAIREQAREADLVLMLATLLHSVAVGNCLPSTTKTVCVDINPATVTQLLDRGSAQAIGMVTDVGAFLPMLADELLPGDWEQDSPAPRHEP